MSTKENKAIANAFVEEVYNRKNVTALDDFIALDYIEHNLANPDETGNRGSARQSLAYFISAFPDCHMTYDDVFAEGDRVAIRFTLRGTHKGEFMGVAPTGEEITFMGIGIARFAEGKIVEMWEISDFPGLMKQLGAISPLEESGA